MNVSFSEHKLAVIVLRYMPESYDDQYYIPTNFIPAVLARLRTKLEAMSGVVDGAKQYKRKGEASNLDQKGKKRFTQNSNNLPKKNNENAGRKKSVRNSVSSAKSMGAHKQPTIPKNAGSTTKKESCLNLSVETNKAEATAKNTQHSKNHRREHRRRSGSSALLCDSSS